MDTKDRKRSGAGSRRSGTATASKRPRQTSVKRPTGAKNVQRRQANKRPGPEVVYTQPMPLNQNSFLLKLITVIAVVVALVLGMSIFFKVGTVTVAGMEKYTAWDIREASGIVEGENLLALSEAKISSNIRSKLPYVDKIRVGIKLPDTVKIEVEELDVVYSIEASDTTWWLMRADGVIVDKTNSADAERYTQIVGVKVESPQIGSAAVAHMPTPEAPTEETQPEDTTPTVPAALSQAPEQLDAAISIIQFLESNGIIGDAASVDVTNLNQLEIWYGQRFQILLGDTTQLSYKIQTVCAAIRDHMESYDSGVLDASMTLQPDPEKEYQLIYTPFE